MDTSTMTIMAKVKLAKLIRAGRVVPAYKTLENGDEVIFAYDRKKGSSKHRDRYILKEPIVVKPGPRPPTPLPIGEKVETTN